MEIPVFGQIRRRFTHMLPEQDCNYLVISFFSAAGFLVDCRENSVFDHPFDQQRACDFDDTVGFRIPDVTDRDTTLGLG